MLQEPVPLAFQKETSWGRISAESWNKQIFIPSGQTTKTGKAKMMPIRQRFVMVYYSNKKGELIRERRYWLTFRKGELSSISDTDKADLKGHPMNSRIMGQELAHLLNPEYSERLMAHVLGTGKIDAEQEPKEQD